MLIYSFFFNLATVAVGSISLKSDRFFPLAIKILSSLSYFTLIMFTSIHLMFIILEILIIINLFINIYNEQNVDLNEHFWYSFTRNILFTKINI